ncbi:MAG TPA: hypothetical protein VF926_00115 [Mycobacterium sp.]
MTIQRRYLPPMLLAVAAAASIATAPTALAEQSCTYPSANSSVCQTPGNVQIVNSPPSVDYAPQFPYFGSSLLIFHHGGHR